MRCGAELMAPKGHGSTAYPVQAALRWGCDAALADRICSFNRRFAEPHGYWQGTRLLTPPPPPPLASVDGADEHTMEGGPHATPACGHVTFFDSVSGRPLFQVRASQHPLRSHSVPPLCLSRCLSHSPC